MQRQIYERIRGFRIKRENKRVKRTKSGEFQETRKIKALLSVFLAIILRWLV